MDQELINNIISGPKFQSVISAEDFYFQKGKDALDKWLEMELSLELRNKLLELADDYNKIQEEAKRDAEINTVLEMLFEIISYCDSKAKDKYRYNKYDDKRNQGNAFVRMYSWVKHLILFKFDQSALAKGSTRNAFAYLLDPKNNCTILSENHRELVASNLIKKEFRSDTFVDDLKALFAEYNLKTKNPENYTLLLSMIIYSIESKWKEEIVALMAADSTGWQDKFIQKQENFNACIIWNTKRPSGTNETIKFLRDIVKDGRSFNLYYCLGDMIKYKATVVDFVEDQKGLDEKKWHEKYQKIFDYSSDFNEYVDGNKIASIVFLAEKFEKIIPISVGEFKFYKTFQMPKHDNLSPVKFEPETESLIISDNPYNQEIFMSVSPLNQIFYGPPGTGKTYHTISKSLELIGVDVKGKERKEIKKLFEAKMKEGQIVFTTFHQSMSYEDFIEGIKPETLGEGVVYNIKSGVFKNLCQSALTPNQIGFDMAYDALKKHLSSVEQVDLKTPTGKEFSISLNSNDNLTLYTGIQKIKQGSLTKENIQKQINGEEKFKGWEGYFKGIITYLKTNFGYSDEINTDKNYVLIIDEINRGNVSQIFGELITLIEEDKRLGKDEELNVTLPYSKEQFGVPSNVFIIGTMNTADRSVEALDVALRRRFCFEEMPPRYDLEKLDYEYGGFKASQILKAINFRIEKLLDKDHRIGHSFFILNEKEQIENKLITSFYKNIIPLLQEYFYGDYGKIGLVLGDGFVRLRELEVEEYAFANFNHESADDFVERPIYEIVDYRNDSMVYYLSNKSKQGVEMNFEKAIKRLMNQEIE